MKNPDILEVTLKVIKAFEKLKISYYPKIADRS